MKTLKKLQPRKGMALVITLGIIVLLTGLLLSFFGLANGRKKVSAASSNNIQSQALARGVASQIKADLLTEIINGSERAVRNDAGVNFYQTANPQNLLPSQSLKDDKLARQWTGGAWVNPNVVNLLKQSNSNTPFSTVVGGSGEAPVRRASNVSTAFTIDPKRWSEPRLFRDQFNLKPNQTPDWIYMSRNGVNPVSYDSQLKDKESEFYVTGRYAFNIYDVGGLLNLNVAGHSAQTPRNLVAGKSSLIMADLSRIPGLNANQGRLENIFEWRNTTLDTWNNVAQNPDENFDPNSNDLTTASSHNGWLSPYTNNVRNDNYMLNRSGLIKLMENVVGPEQARESLPYLTNFNRFVDRPYHEPSNDRPLIITGSNSGGSDALGQDDLINPGARDDQGNLLITRKFPLEYISFLDDPQANQEQILQYFGLNFNNGEYLYKDGHQISDLQRASNNLANGSDIPNFFEVLKAAIHAGSLGVQLGSSNNDVNVAYQILRNSGDTFDGPGELITRDQIGTDSPDSRLDFQIFQIGLNIIDQYDRDSIPTFLTIDDPILGETVTLSGNEAIPYFYATHGVNVHTNRSNLTPPGFEPVNSNWIDGLVTYTRVVVPKLWNPSVSATPSEGADLPNSFRILGKYAGDFPSLRNGSNSSAQVEGEWERARTSAGSRTGFNFTSEIGLDGANFESSSTDNPSFDLADNNNGYSYTFNLPSDWQSSWPYPFSDPFSLYKDNFPVSGISIVGAQPNRTQFNCINPILEDGFNFAGNSSSITVDSTSFNFYGIPLASSVHGCLVRMPPSPNYVINTGNDHGDGILRLQLQIRPKGGNRDLTYDTIDYFQRDADRTISGGFNALNQGANSVFGAVSTRERLFGSLKMDPRTSRWGTHLIQSNPVNMRFNRRHGLTEDSRFGRQEWLEGQSTLPTDDTSRLGPILDANFANNQNNLFTISSSGSSFNNGIAMHEIAFNNQNSRSFSYTDPDGIQRPAMGANYSGTGLFAQPLAKSNQSLDSLNRRVDPEIFSSRPIILNRPFQSVAELGFVFRDTPWKNLDFFNANSGDSSLLDFFTLYSSINENQPGELTIEGSPIVSGKIDLNTPHQEVLTAILSGVNKSNHRPNTLDPLDNQNELDLISRTVLNNALGTNQPRPYRDLSELVGYPVSQTEYAGLADEMNRIVGTNQEQAVQQFKETHLRALGNNTAVGTWNLMFDVFVEAGNLKTQSKSLRDFLAKSTKRFWIHLSIDRSTGEILGEHWEEIY